MNLIKRICTGLLCLGLLLSCLPMEVFADIRNPSQAQASSYTTSTELAALLNGVFSGDIDIYSNTGCSSEVSMPLGLNMKKKTTYYIKDKTTGDSTGGRQCYIYAQAVYNKLFNEYPGHGDNLEHSKVAISGGSNTMSYSKFQDAGVRCGAYMRTTNKSSGAYSSSSGHSMIILSYNSSGVTYLEGNGDGNGLIRIDTKTWSEFNKAHLSGRSRYLNHVIQPTDTYYNNNYVSYTVSYNANGGSGAPAAQVKKHGKTLTLSGTIPTKSGHTFQGWGTSATATSVSYKAGASFNSNANTTLYAVWTKGCPSSHSYRYAVTKNPTTGAAGTLTGTCSKCDKTTTVNLPKLNTTDYSYKVKTAATCTANGTGLYTWKTTTYGSFSFTVTLNKTGHSYNSGVVTTPAGCTKAGVKTFTCRSCAHAYTQSIAAVGHSYNSGVITTPAGCTQAGVKTFTCSRCAHAYTQSIAAVGHSYNSGVITTPAGCTQAGVKTFTCSGCAHAYTQSIAAIGHSYQDGACTHCGQIDPDYTVLTLTATCFGGHTEGVTVQVYAKDSETALYTLEAENGTCELRGLATGEYTISFSKVNHITEIHTVTLEGGSSTLDVIIYLLGDLSGDGKVNVADTSMAYTHTWGGNLITNQYTKACGDITGDGKINVADVSRIYAHIRGTISIWE